MKAGLTSQETLQICLSGMHKVQASVVTNAADLHGASTTLAKGLSTHLNASPTGDMARTICRLALHCSTK